MRFPCRGEEDRPHLSGRRDCLTCLPENRTHAPQEEMADPSAEELRVFSQADELNSAEMNPAEA
jgi:hypothetical protein